MFVNFASQNFKLYARFAGFFRRKQLIPPYIFPGDSKLRVNSLAVKIALFFGGKVGSAWEGTSESNCLSPRTKAPRAQGRARRPIRTHGGRTYGKEDNRQAKCERSEHFAQKFCFAKFLILWSLPPAKTTHLPIHFPRRVEITAKQFGSENRLRRGKNA